MLVIDGAQPGSAAFVRAALAASRPLRRLSFWEQISAIEIRGEASLLVIDGHVVPETESIFFLGSPRFARPLHGLEDAEFGWAEWNASLTAVLSLRRQVIPNGEILIFNPHIVTNPFAFLYRFGEAASVACRTECEASSTFWLIAARGMLLAYPERMIAPFVGNGVDAALYSVLAETKLDYAVLELRNVAGEVMLTRVHLTPPTYAPMNLHSTLAQMFGGSP
jgi:hypothetical protein